MINKIFDFINPGANFKKKIDGLKVGDIIYPAHNGTNGWFCSPQWHLVSKVDKKGRLVCASIIYDYNVVRAIELIQETYDLKLKNTTRR